MQTQIKMLENFFYDKILLYQELVEYLKKERDYLTKTDMDVLWEISAKKQDIVFRIETIREKILAALTELSVEHGMDVSSFSLAKVVSLIPSTQRVGLRKIYLTLVGLKTQTRQLSAENKVFIEESLDFLDEIMSIIAGFRAGNSLYDGGGVVKTKGHSNLLFCREV
jgi:hypothetical protein